MEFFILDDVELLFLSLLLEEDEEVVLLRGVFILGELFFGGFLDFVIIDVLVREVDNVDL